MGKTTKKIISATFIIIALAIFVSFKFAQGDKYADGSYVRGKYGKYCYSMQGKPKTIHSPIAFKSLEDCLNSFNGR